MLPTTEKVICIRIRFLSKIVKKQAGFVIFNSWYGQITVEFACFFVSRLWWRPLVKTRLFKKQFDLGAEFPKKL
jgi:hypothetical protein